MQVKVRRRKTRKGRLVSLGCAVSGMFLTASLFYLIMAYLHRNSATNSSSTSSSAVVSVDSVVFRGRSSGTGTLRAERERLEATATATAQRDIATVTIQQVKDVLYNFSTDLRKRLSTQHEGESDYIKVYQIYHNLTVERLYPFDMHYLQHMPPRRSDDSIFLSVASYRDENCVNTLSQAYQNAGNPQQLFVGLVQQNCESDCMSGVLADGKVVPVEPDQDCHQGFCDLHPQHCDQVRALNLQESDSMGPYAARYFASKLWDGESWYMQIDSHSTFAPRWDVDSISMLRAAPSRRPILSHYPPPSEDLDFQKERRKPAPRICGGIFAETQTEAQIVRLEECEQYDREKLPLPRFAPFVAAGYFVAHSGFLKEVPFDPFLPWIFMGEEIIMSARFWTHGYDIFSPVHSVIGHMYVRRHKPKFWESVWRFLWDRVDDKIQDLVIHRVKHQLGYPESAPDLVPCSSRVFFALQHYSMGKVRTVEAYLKMAGLDPVRKENLDISWCTQGRVPEYAKDKAHLYE